MRGTDNMLRNSSKITLECGALVFSCTSVLVLGTGSVSVNHKLGKEMMLDLYSGMMKN